MIEDKNLDNFSIVLTLFGFCLAYFIGFNEKLDEIIIHLNAILLLIIAFKVSIVIGNEAIKDEKNAIFIPNFIHKNLAISFIVLYIVSAHLKWEFLVDKMGIYQKSRLSFTAKIPILNARMVF